MFISVVVLLWAPPSVPLSPPGLSPVQGNTFPYSCCYSNQNSFPLFSFDHVICHILLWVWPLGAFQAELNSEVMRWACVLFVLTVDSGSQTLAKGGEQVLFFFSPKTWKNKCQGCFCQIHLFLCDHINFKTRLNTTNPPRRTTWYIGFKHDLIDMCFGRKWRNDFKLSS